MCLIEGEGSDGALSREGWEGGRHLCCHNSVSSWQWPRA